ncbi:MAG: hypothetical protein ACREBQ_13825, partial [Nitrososphaerales archaeon]
NIPNVFLFQFDVIERYAMLQAEDKSLLVIASTDRQLLWMFVLEIVKRKTIIVKQFDKLVEFISALE